MQGTVCGTLAQRSVREAFGLALLRIMGEEL